MHASVEDQAVIMIIYVCISASRERIGEEDGRVVEGGNDRLPHPPTHQSRLPREIHDKFAGKSREVRAHPLIQHLTLIPNHLGHQPDIQGIFLFL